MSDVRRSPRFKNIVFGLGIAVATYVVFAAWFLVSPPGILLLLILFALVLSAATWISSEITKSKNWPANLALGAVAACVIVGSIIYLPARLLSYPVEFQVISAQREAGKNDGKGVYMVSVRFRDGHTDKMKNVDAPAFFKYASGTLQSTFEDKAGKDVWFHGRAYGFRVGFTSSYPNIVFATPIS